jgi:hypothetical protein
VAVTWRYNFDLASLTRYSCLALQARPGFMSISLLFHT